MVQRQHREEPVVRRQLHVRRDGIDVIGQVGVGNHHALGRRSRAAGKDQHGKGVRVDLDVGKIAAAHIQQEFAFFHHVLEADEAAADLVDRIHHHEIHHARAVIGNLLDLVLLARRIDDRRRIGTLDDVLQLVVRQFLVRRHGDAGAAQQRHVGNVPLVGGFADDEDLFTLELEGPRQAGAQLEHVLAEAAEGDLLKAVLAVEFFHDKRPLGIGLGASVKKLLNRLIFCARITFALFAAAALFAQLLQFCGCIFNLQFFDVINIPHLVFWQPKIRDTF